MKIDLAGVKHRGFAVGLNESMGYAGVAIMAYVAAILASTYGLRPVPFLVTAGLAVLGTLLSLTVRETSRRKRASEPRSPLGPALKRGLGADPALAAASLGGFATNLKDGLIWGLLPLLLASRGIDLPRIGFVVALYPLVWALAQIVTGPLSDRIGRKALIVPGFLVQAAGLALLVASHTYIWCVLAACVLGLGTGMVYPTLIAFVGDASLPWERATAIGVYRFVRDLGYVGGAVAGGLLADSFGLGAAFSAGIVLTLLSGVLIMGARSATRPSLPAPVVTDPGGD
jgi:MFS family permease